MRFQIETANIEINKIRTLPYVFTEEGVSMLAAVLRTPVAEEMSIAIMDAFVMMRRYFSPNTVNQNSINNIVIDDHNRLVKLDKKVGEIQDKLKDYEEKDVFHGVFFKGKIYDAYSVILDIFQSAKKEVIIIDGYADKTVLDMIRALNCKVILITKNNGKLSQLDIESIKVSIII